MPGLRSQTTDGVKGAFLISTLGPPGEAGPKPDLARGSQLENRIHPGARRPFSENGPGPCFRCLATGSWRPTGQGALLLGISDNI